MAGPPSRPAARSGAGSGAGAGSATDTAPGPDTEAQALGLQRVMGFVTSFVAPATLVTSLLFYFGYVSSREYFRYFGVDVDLLGLSPREFVMRSPGALFVPITILLLVSVALILGHRILRRHLRETDERGQRAVLATFAIAGAVLLLAGLTLAFLFPVLRAWRFYAFLTPFTLAVGSGLAAYAAATARSLSRAREGRNLVVLLVLVLVAGTFWTAATVAQWWGLGQARALAADFSTLPAVVLDTKERLSPGNDAISLQELPLDAPAQASATASSPYRYRYFGLRLLVYGGGRLYLVPDRWSPDASTVVVPYDDSVRLRFRFTPDINPPR